MALAKKKIKPTPVTLRKPDEVNRTLEELKAGKVLGRVVLDSRRRSSLFPQAILPAEALMANRLIEARPDIVMGKPVVAGTRVTVELVLEKLAAGETMEQLLQAHPKLTREGIRAALDFAAQALKADLVYPLEPTDA